MRLIQIKRGTDSKRASIVLNNGEPFWATDTKSLYVGDGNTTGGFLVTNTSILSTSMLTTGTQTITGVKFFTNNSFFSDYLYEGNGVTLVAQLISGNTKFSDVDGISIDLSRYTLTGDPALEPSYINWLNGIFYNIQQNTTLNFNNRILSGNWRLANNTPPSNSTSNGNIGNVSISGDSLCFCTGLNQWGKLNLSTF